VTNYVGDAFPLENGTVAIIPNRPNNLPESIVQGSARANTVYMGHYELDPEGTYIVFVLGDIALQVRLTQPEVALYGGMLIGISGWYPGKG